MILASAVAVASILAPAPVASLAADGNTVAFAVASRPTDCEHVRMWTRGKRVVRFGTARPCGDATSTGSGIGGPVVAGERALWVTYTGGNIREWSLWTASRWSPRPLRLRFVARDVDAAAPFVLGGGDHSRLGSLLPYAIDNAVVVLHANGGRAFTWHAPARVVGLDASAGEVAVALADRRVVVLDGGGRVLREEQFAFAVESVHVTGSSLLARGTALLELRGLGAPRRYNLARGAVSVDAVGNVALYVVDRRVHTFRLDDRWNRRIATADAAQLEPSGMFLASGRRITFVRS